MFLSVCVYVHACARSYSCNMNMNLDVNVDKETDAKIQGAQYFDHFRKNAITPLNIVVSV